MAECTISIPPFFCKHEYGVYINTDQPSVRTLGMKRIRLTSALISFLRSLVFQVGVVLILPVFFQIDGRWFSVVAAELVAAVMTLLLIRAKKKKYHY